MVPVVFKTAHILATGESEFEGKKFPFVTLAIVGAKYRCKASQVVKAKAEEIRTANPAGQVQAVVWLEDTPKGLKLTLDKIDKIAA